MKIETIKWLSGAVRIIDQTELPLRLVYLDCRNVETLAQAIEELKVRGAPAIGVAAAYGVVLSIWGHRGTSQELEQKIRWAVDRLSHTRPTAIYTAKSQGKHIRVFADETRPLLQGARLTTWELLQSGIEVTLICDNAAATLMRKGKVDAVIVGADRIARNGDVANKVGTYGLAVLAKEHHIPFYVAAPLSTLDMNLA
ncbi:MAG: S-methyl-5-thioribose-1-phosphate isomerase, partial [Candidatus Latescibacteria bacterium 4484_181]